MGRRLFQKEEPGAISATSLRRGRFESLLKQGLGGSFPMFQTGFRLVSDLVQTSSEVQTPLGDQGLGPARQHRNHLQVVSGLFFSGRAVLFGACDRIEIRSSGAPDPLAHD